MKPLNHRSLGGSIDWIAEVVKPIFERIEEGETYRIAVEKRRSQLSHREVIEHLAKMVPRKVNLTQPNWVVLVEIIGRGTAVSVLHPSQIFSVHKLYQAQLIALGRARLKCGSIMVEVPRVLHEFGDWDGLSAAIDRISQDASGSRVKN